MNPIICKAASLTCAHAKDNIDAFNLMSILKRLHPPDKYLMEVLRLCEELVGSIKILKITPPKSTL